MTSSNTQTHSTLIGYLMWIFGFIGIHRFYYGKPVTGVIWLLTGGLLFVGWIVDLFLIPSMNQQAAEKYASGRYDYTITWLLQLFLGYFGIHRFYMGKIISGIIWLCTGGLFGIGWLYDFCTLNQQIDEANRATA